MGRVLVCVILVLAATARESAAQADRVTFHRDVEPIFQRHCQSCHRPGQIGPMPLVTFQQARPWARAILTKVVERSMPPWFADPAHNTFTNDRSLKPAEIETVRRWVDGGAVEGDPKEAPAPVVWPAQGWQIKPDVVVSMPEYRVPARGVLEWESLAVPFPAKEDTWVTSVEVLPSEPGVVHHICFGFQKHRPDVVYDRYEWEEIPRDAKGMKVQGGLLSRVAERLLPESFKARAVGSSQVETLPGRSRLRASGTMCYVPGLSTHDYRVHGAAKLVPAGSDIVITFHYQTNGTAAIDRTKIGFTVTKNPPAKKFVEFAPSGGAAMAIPPNDGNYLAPPFELRILQNAKLVWMWPHMHLRGKDVTYTLVHPSGRRQILLRIPRYDFNWQLAYLTNVDVPRGSRLRAEAHYDNSSRNRANPDPSAWVYQGKQSWEEMFTPAFGLVVDRNVNVKELTSKYVEEEGG
jgi:hypothetical protein